MAEDFVDGGSISVGDLAGTVYLNNDYIGRSVYRYLSHCCDIKVDPGPAPDDPRILFDCEQIQVDLANPRMQEEPSIIFLQQESSSVTVNIETESGQPISQESGEPIEAEGDALLAASIISDEQGEGIEWENDLVATYVVYNYANGRKKPAYNLTQIGNKQYPQPDPDSIYRSPEIVYINDVGAGIYHSDQYFWRTSNGFELDSKRSWYTEVVLLECDRSIKIEQGNCDNISFSLGNDLLTNTSNRGIAEYWKFQIFEGEPFIYLRDGETAEKETTDPTTDCISTEIENCLLTELGNKIIPEGLYRNPSYFDLDCLLQENNISIDDEQGNCLQHIPQELQDNDEEENEESSETCLHLENCEPLESEEGGACIKLDGLARVFECVVGESEGGGQNFTPNQQGSIKQYPIETEKGIHLHANNGEFLEIQGLFEIEGLETELGDYINDEINGISIDREVREDHLQTEEGRGIHFNEVGSADKAIEEYRTLIYSSENISEREFSYNIGHGNYYIVANAYDEDNQPLLAQSVNELYIPSCDCLETEAGTCIHAENGVKISPEYLNITRPDEFNPCALNIEYFGNLTFSNYNLKTETNEDILIEGFASCSDEGLTEQEEQDATNHELNLISALYPCTGHINTESYFTSREELTTEAGQMIEWSIIDTTLTTEDCEILKANNNYELELE